MDKFLIKN
jgi:hypothetical protein